MLKYRDLITTFEGVLTKVCKEEKVSFPTTLGVNAFRFVLLGIHSSPRIAHRFIEFRGFLNEFMQNQKKRGSKQKSGIIKVRSRGRSHRRSIVR